MIPILPWPLWLLIALFPMHFRWTCNSSKQVFSLKMYALCWMVSIDKSEEKWNWDMNFTLIEVARILINTKNYEKHTNDLNDKNNSP